MPPTTPPPSLLTLVHVTHEAIDQMGGIGTVLEGMLTSPFYRQHVGRSILVGTLPHPHSRPEKPIQRLGEFATACYYSGSDHYDPNGLGSLFQPIEWAFGVNLVYGKRSFRDPGGDRPGDAEVLLVDVSDPSRERLGAFKWKLYEKYGIDSRRYENGWDYEEYCRLAEPAYYALCQLLRPENLPAVLISHEFMGMCAALRCLDDRARFRTVFHAHECSTARRIVEGLPGFDTAFYPAMRAAAAKGKYIEDVFGDQSDFARHALVESTHLLDAVLAVGPETAEELKFLSPRMKQANVKIAYNGLPAPKVTLADKSRSRMMVDRWLKNVLGYAPDYLITHVTRPVTSKGLWRDQKVLHHLQPLLKSAGKRAVYLLLTCGAPPRPLEQVNEMARHHGWPARHVEGYPDLCGPETAIFRDMQEFAPGEKPIDKSDPPVMASILVNQFGFTHDRLGDAAPVEMTLDDLRRSADCELGMSTYEPYGIAHLEALHAGAVCVPSTVCGCLGLVRRAMRELKMTEAECAVVLPGDFTDHDVHDPMKWTARERDALEEGVCVQIAGELFKRLPKSDADRARLLELGQKLAQRMSWDVVCETDILPVLREIVARKR